jgi:glycerol-3-phosphate acyltransferase PlsX
LDYREYGGALLFGVRGNVIVAHGRSDAEAIRNAIVIAKREVLQGVSEAFKD